MADRSAHGKVADTSSSDQRGLADKHTGILPSIQAAVLSPLVYAYRNILLLRFPVQYAATYSARIEAVLSRIEADEKGSNAEHSWELLRRELFRWSKALVVFGLVLFM